MTSPRFCLDSALKTPLQGIIFDLDGTLVDSMPMTIRAFNAGLAAAELPELPFPLLSSYFGTGEDEVFRLIARDFKEGGWDGLGRNKHPQKTIPQLSHELELQAHTAYQTCIQYTTDHLHESPLHEGILEVIHELCARKIPLTVFTGRSRPTTEKILRHHQIEKTFLRIITNNEVASPKPAPDGVLLALEALSACDPKGILFVGDSHLDWRSARAGGVQAGAALWDAGASEIPADFEEYVRKLKHPSDLLW